jgi:hypothetical protein
MRLLKPNEISSKPDPPDNEIRSSATSIEEIAVVIAKDSDSIPSRRGSPSVCGIVIAEAAETLVGLPFLHLLMS